MTSIYNTNYTPQPANWFLQFSIGNSILTPIPPQYVVSFSQTRTIVNQGNLFELVLIYEGGSSDLENLIASTGFGGGTGKMNNVMFRYGIVGGASTGVFEGVLTGYLPEFLGGAVQLTLSGTTSAYVSGLKAYTKAYIGMSIDQIVTQIAHDNGLKIGIIEPCVPLLTAYDDITGTPTHKYFVQNNVTPYRFIQEELCPYAVSALSGMGGYMVYFSDKSHTTINFCTPQFKNEPVARYSFYAGPESNIISWSPQILSANNLLGQGGGIVANAGIDTTNNNLKAYFSSNATENTMPTLGTKTFENKNVALTFLNTSSGIEAEMRAKAKSLWTMNASLNTQSSMVIPGDPSLETNSTVDILINDPDGRPHYTTGTYLVAQVIDQLDSSGYTSQVSLIKNAIGKGAGHAGGRQVNKPKPRGLRTTGK